MSRLARVPGARRPRGGGRCRGARFVAPREERALWDERLGRALSRRGGRLDPRRLDGRGDGRPAARARSCSAGSPAPASCSARRRAPDARGSARARRARASMAPARLAAGAAPLLRRRGAAALLPASRPSCGRTGCCARAGRGVPVTVVSARLSERSVARLPAPGRAAARAGRGLAGVLCQTEADLGRWRALGAAARASAVTGNLKDDGLRAALPRPRGGARRSLGLEPGPAAARARQRAPGRGAGPGARPGGGCRRRCATRGRWWPCRGIRRPRPRCARRRRPRGSRWRRGRRCGPAEGVALGRSPRRAERATTRAAEVAFVGGSLRRLRGAQPARARGLRRGAADGASPRRRRRRGAGARAAGALRVAAAARRSWRGRWRGLLGDGAARGAGGAAARRWRANGGARRGGRSPAGGVGPVAGGVSGALARLGAALYGAAWEMRRRRTRAAARRRRPCRRAW